ncbi:400_t:CDS:2 [Cetraspora pellucida]|uniref:400_t:CDS:1 n=1 Tax=Cetraspora pellucida TaxID=1433469 RepID=A0ACA9N1D5_9GLOM|nr:400_t:CDS:2 [Cetraspora pellucida]
MNKRGGSRRRSWVWNYFKLLPTICETKGQCDELKNDETKCNHIIETDEGIGNFSYHLQSAHGITKFGQLVLDTSQSNNAKNMKNAIMEIEEINCLSFDNVKIALFNALNHYYKYPIHEALLATLLDPRNKKIKFATYLQRLEAENYLISKYDVFKEQKSTPINIMQTDDHEEEENVLLAAMYDLIQDSEANNKIQAYLSLPKIPNT